MSERGRLYVPRPGDPQLTPDLDYRITCRDAADLGYPALGVELRSGPGFPILQDDMVEMEAQGAGRWTKLRCATPRGIRYVLPTTRGAWRYYDYNQMNWILYRQPTDLSPKIQVGLGGLTGLLADYNGTHVLRAGSREALVAQVNEWGLNSWEVLEKLNYGPSNAFHGVICLGQLNWDAYWDLEVGRYLAPNTMIVRFLGPIRSARPDGVYALAPDSGPGTCEVTAGSSYAWWWGQNHS
jgi:hypothetical protein